MQANTITLSVDKAHDSNPVNVTFSRLEETVSRTTYVDKTAHTSAMRCQMQFYRTPGKAVGESRGQDKCDIKFTFDTEVDNRSGDGTIVAPKIGTTGFSLPVGCTAAELIELRQYMVAVLNDDDVMNALMQFLEI